MNEQIPILSPRQVGLGARRQKARKRSSARARINRAEKKAAELAVWQYHARLASKPEARRLKNRAMDELRRRNITKKRANRAEAKKNPFGTAELRGVGRGGQGGFVLLPEASAP